MVTVYLSALKNVEFFKNSSKLLRSLEEVLRLLILSKNRERKQATTRNILGTIEELSPIEIQIMMIILTIIIVIIIINTVKFKGFMMPRKVA